MPRDHDKVGIALSTLIREMAMVHFGITLDEAQAFAERIDTRIKEGPSDWLSLFDGTTFDKTFEPTKKYV